MKIWTSLYARPNPRKTHMVPIGRNRTSRKAGSLFDQSLYKNYKLNKV